MRQLVEEGLAPLVALKGSVNAAAEYLNRLLGQVGEEGAIYPNRLHALLKDDPTRALNAGSVALISKAVDALWAEGVLTSEKAKYSLDAQSAEVAASWAASRKHGDAVEQLVRQKRLPPAVVTYLLRRAGEAPAAAATSSMTATPGERARSPDWSFQDEAVRIAVNRLSAASIPRIGVVVPTGGGKTTIGLRMALEQLARDSSGLKRVVWVSHRIGLRRQAHRGLQKLLTAQARLPENAPSLANRIDFIMVSELETYLSGAATTPALVIVDEAHHAAAASYDPLFEGPSDLPILGLTATPRRTDLQPIRVEEIAYQITYRQLAERGVVLRPEFKPFPVENFDWSTDALDELASELLDQAEDQYIKTLVIAPRIDRVRDFFDAIVKELSRLKVDGGHVLDLDDVGYITSEGNSLNLTAEEFLDIFAAKPRGIIVSAQMLIEGFDDPAINTVVVTYPSSSLLLLMQAAGRCVRWHPEKKQSFVIQARNDDLAYYFDQRWLYQEISDALRPELRDISYSSTADLVAKAEEVLESSRVKDSERASILGEVRQLNAGATCRLMLAGLPYEGAPEDFETQSTWWAILETDKNSAQLRAVFNEFSEEDPEVDPQAALKRIGERAGIQKNLEAGSPWRSYSTLLASMVNARRETTESAIPAVQAGRPYQRNGATTWLRYVTFNFDAAAPAELLAFLADCYNKEQTLERLLASGTPFKAVLKIPVPMALFEAHLLTDEVDKSLRQLLERFRASLSSVAIDKRFETLGALTTGAEVVALPRRVLDRLELFLTPDDFDKRIFVISIQREN